MSKDNSFDTFSQMWRRQLAFTSLYLRTRYKPLEQLTEDDRVKLSKEYLLSLHSELTEVLNNVPWKPHRFTQLSNRDQLLEELVDVLKYLLGLMQVWKVTPNELVRIFEKKSQVVEQRFNQDYLLPSHLVSSKVAIVDIDDTVADWSGGFQRWVEENEPGIKPDSYAKHVDPGLRTRLKKKAHESGHMEKLPLIQGAKEGIKALEEAGYVIMWLTARPISECPRLILDTVAWLKQQSLPSNYVFYSDLNKHLFVVDHLPTAQVLFDDDVEIVAHAKEAGIKAYHVEGKNFSEKIEEFLKS